MKSVAAILTLGLIAAIRAQDSCAPLAAKIPSCATQCIASAAAGVGCSSPTDFACQCKNTAAINGAALNCVLSGCGAQTGLAVQASASAVCACVATAGSAKATSAAAAPSSAPVVKTAPGPMVTKASSPVVASSTAATGSAAPFPSVKQISDGQVQAATATAAPSATGAMMPNSTVPFTGAGVKIVASVGGLMLAVGAAIIAM